MNIWIAIGILAIAAGLIWWVLTDQKTPEFPPAPPPEPEDGGPITTQDTGGGAPPSPPA